MQIHILSVSKRPPAWTLAAVAEYQKRLRHHLTISYRDLTPVHGAASPEEQREREAKLILRALPSRAHTVALDERGELWSTAELAAQLDRWQNDHQEVALIIGGAEGLATSVRESAAGLWSLSRLTFPHQLVRVIMLEQLYRAWSVLNHHPYHRA